MRQRINLLAANCLLRFINIMSKIGKQPIAIKDTVELSLDASNLTVKGPKGTLTFNLPHEVDVVIGTKFVRVAINQDTRHAHGLWGLWRTLISNAIHGVVEGFEKKLELKGVGYRAAMKGSDLELQLGLSHPVVYTPADGVSLAVEGPIITITGFDKQMVGQTAAHIRAYRPPEPYKGKGIRYTDEVIIRKAGKAAKAK